MLDTAPTARMTAFLGKFDAALAAGDIDAAVAMFAEESYWRDLVAFTWNIKTMEGRDQVRDMLTHCLKGVKPRDWRVAEGEIAIEADGVLESWISFETEVARGYGLVRIKDGLIWTLLTTMAELKGHEEKAGFSRVRGARHGVNPGAKSWKELRDEEIEKLGYDTQPYVLVIGGGQGAIGLGARLRQLGVPTIIVEKNERAGDSWRKRYKSLCLHDPVWYDHLPYIDFPKNWPVFSPKDKIGDWLEMYAKVMELNYWSKTTARSAKFDPTKKEWTVVVDRDGKKVTLHPQQLVFATLPKFRGMKTFKGERHHSSAHPGPDAFKGKKVVVIGSNNSAHDICAALYEAGVDVTMIQRSSTNVIRSDTLMELGLGDLYSERAVRSGITTAKADLIFASLPYGALAALQKPIYDKIHQRDADFYKGLEKAGFKVDFGDDESGLFMKYLRRGSGYYIDVGASQLIIDGKVKLVSGQVEEITPHGVKLDNGKEVPVDRLCDGL
jgi:putative flavoprotein involved in K+ transport